MPSKCTNASIPSHPPATHARAQIQIHAEAAVVRGCSRLAVTPERSWPGYASQARHQPDRPSYRVGRPAGQAAHRLGTPQSPCPDPRVRRTDAVAVGTHHTFLSSAVRAALPALPTAMIARGSGGRKGFDAWGARRGRHPCPPSAPRRAPYLSGADATPYGAAGSSTPRWRDDGTCKGPDAPATVARAIGAGHGARR